MRFQSVSALGSLLLTLGLVACDGDKDVTDLYKFPDAAAAAAEDTKDIAVRVTIGLGDGLADGTVDLGDNAFLLNAFSLDADGLQVEVAPVGETPVADLPVSLTGTTTTFDAIVRVPADVDPGEDGYEFHFNLKAAGTTLLDESLDGTLDALRASVVPGTEAETNPVDLSLRATLAYKLLETFGTVRGTKAFTAYDELVALLPSSVFDGVDKATKHAYPDFVSGILGRLQNEILTQKDLQSKVAEQLFSAVDLGDSDATEAAAAQTFASSFTSQLKTMAESVQKLFADAGSSTSKVFQSGTIDPTKLPDPTSYEDGVYAPVAVAFTDTDTTTTLGGKVVITPPTLATGISSYNVYFGGDTRAKSQLKLAGKVAATASPLALTVAAGTALPSGATRFWAFPVANATQLDLPASVKITNVINTPTLKAPALKAAELITFAADAAVGSKLSMTNSGGRSLTSCTMTPILGAIPATFSVAVSSDKATCVVVLEAAPTNGADWDVDVTATNAAGTSTVRARFKKTASVLNPPDITTQATYTFASTATSGTTMNMVNTGGGSLTSCVMELDCRGAAAGCLASAGFTVAVSDNASTCTITLAGTSNHAMTAHVTVTATNAAGDSVLTGGTFTRPVPKPVIADASIVFPADAADGDEMVVTNSGGRDLTACEFAAGRRGTAPFEADMDAGSDHCVVRLVDRSAYSAADHETMQATNATGSDTAALVISIADLAPDLADATITFSGAPADGDELDVTNNGGGNLTSCTMATPLSPAPFDVRVSDDHSTCVIELVDLSAYSGPVDAEVTATNSAGSDTATLSLVVVTLDLPELMDHETITIRDTDMPRSKDMTNDGGGDLTACIFVPDVRTATIPFTVAVSGDASTCEVTYVGSSSGEESMTGTVTATNAAGDSEVSVVFEFIFTGR
jgi:hypothetical protein